MTASWVQKQQSVLDVSKRQRFPRGECDDERNPLCHPAIDGANASGSLLRRGTKLSTVEEDLHPSRGR